MPIKIYKNLDTFIEITNWDDWKYLFNEFTYEVKTLDDLDNLFRLQYEEVLDDNGKPIDKSIIIIRNGDYSSFNISLDNLCNIKMFICEPNVILNNNCHLTFTGETEPLLYFINTDINIKFENSTGKIFNSIVNKIIGASSVDNCIVNYVEQSSNINNTVINQTISNCCNITNSSYLKTISSCSNISNCNSIRDIINSSNISNCYIYTSINSCNYIKNTTIDITSNNNLTYVIQNCNHFVNCSISIKNSSNNNLTYVIQNCNHFVNCSINYKPTILYYMPKFMFYNCSFLNNCQIFYNVQPKFLKEKHFNSGIMSSCSFLINNKIQNTLYVNETNTNNNYDLIYCLFYYCNNFTGNDIWNYFYVDTTNNSFYIRKLYSCDYIFNNRIKYNISKRGSNVVEQEDIDTFYINYNIYS